MNRLDVPWEKIRKSVEDGMPLVKVAELFNIKPATLKQKSYTENWSTPQRKSKKIKEAIEDHGNRVAGVQGCRVAVNNTLEDQLSRGLPLKNLESKSSEVDFDQATKDYRSKGVLKMAMLLDAAILAPPKNYKDLDIADKIMRRLLGIDDNEGKSSTIVSLQLVNERLQGSLQSEIIEGDFIAESGAEAVQDSTLQSESTGTASAFSESDCDTSSEEEMPSV